MSNPRALITGVTGQDGAYLARLLLQKGYQVWGTSRANSTDCAWRLAELGIQQDVTVVPLELKDYSEISSLVKEVLPNEVYNLAAQSFIGASFEDPLYTAEVNAFGAAKLLEAIRRSAPSARFYQASSSLLYGPDAPSPQNEATAFRPSNPYASAKLFAHWLTTNYRENFAMYACSGILFNHESPLRGTEFVTRKIIQGLAQMTRGRTEPITLGNIHAERDWGFAGDYVRGMWLMLQQDHPDDFVLATGKPHTVREFAESAAMFLGQELQWEGDFGNETGAVATSTGRRIFEIQSDSFRPAGTDSLVGEPTKANVRLGWQAKVDFHGLIKMMGEAELTRLKGWTPGAAPACPTN